MSNKRPPTGNLMSFLSNHPETPQHPGTQRQSGPRTQASSPISPKAAASGAHFDELAASFRARNPLPRDKRSGPSLIEGLPDPHELFDL
jgi:hypothetical protein